MLKVNEYFDGAVKSIGFQSETYPATVGVMKKGDYEFGTNQPEAMTVISGSLLVQLPGEKDFKKYNANETFHVPGNVKFKVKAESAAAYLCLYQ
ncbi:MAG TPA: hypothetical protein DHW82_01385 [Spirochaetia bacterium]|nr:MAG: hypothetical protein A2Y41_07005 [Spirochaetes bacterium GWB1_36_13]HCL55650.1 hypothetical protein [Spirochaetia bacterium]